MKRFGYYGLSIAAAAGAYLLIRAEGLELAAFSGHAASRIATTAPELLGPVMLSLAAITLGSQFLGWLAKRWFAQPPVIGEILAGVLLGPSLLGAIAPDVSDFLFPSEVIPILGVIAKIGVVLFMFVIGLEIDIAALRRSSRSTFAISSGGIVLPFLFGSALALWLYPRYGSEEIGFTGFSLFVGVSLSLTAFPVLARILREFGVQQTPFGTMALACAAIGDVTAWTLLALVVGFVRRDVGHAFWVIPSIGIYVVAMVFLVGPRLKTLAATAIGRDGTIPASVLAQIFVGLLLSATIAERIGIHALFGAFVFGLLIPPGAELSRALRTRIEDLVGILFLPAFFVFTGLRTRIGLLQGSADWAACGLVILVATVGKFGGTYLVARLVGIDRRQSGALGVLMNTRGLVELIVLNVGLDLGVLDPRLFAILVIMALATTFSASPLFAWLIRSRGLDTQQATASVNR